MGIDAITLAVAKKYTNDSMAGAGAVAGVPCKIQSITEITGGHRVTFLWTDNNGDDHTSTMDVMNGDKGDTGATGATGKGIKSMAINGSNHLVVTFTDDTTSDAGEIPNVQADWNEESSTADAYIKNKPELGTAAAKDYTPNVAPNNHNLVESNAVYNAINTALTSVYTPRGELTCAELTSSLLIAANVGNIYEMSDSGTTTDLFLQGAGVTISVGSNVGIIQTGVDTYKFNLMANSFDLHDYQKKVESATSGNFAGLDANGQTTDSGKKASDFATATALANEAATRSAMGAKNLLPSEAESIVKNGVTFVVNSDKSITISTESSGASSNSIVGINTNYKPKAGAYILSSGIQDNKCYLTMDAYNGNTWVKGLGNTASGEASFTVDYDGYDTIRVYVAVLSGAIYTTPKTIYPMIRLATDADTTYRPYVPTNADLLSYTDNGVLGAKNLLNIDSGTVSNCSLANNGFTNTNTDARDFFNFAVKALDSSSTLIISMASQSITNAGEYSFDVTIPDNTAYILVQHVGSTRNIQISIPSSLKAGNYIFSFKVQSANPTTVGGLDVRNIMIRLATDSDPTYQPYAMTNRELTEVKTISATENTSIIDSVNGYFLRVGKLAMLRGYFHVNVAASRYDTLFTLGERTAATSGQNFYVIALDNTSHSYMLKVNATDIIVEDINGLPVGNYAIIGELIME